MDLLLFKKVGAALLIASNFVLLFMSFSAYRRKQSLPDAYFTLLLFSPVIAAWQLGLGISLLLTGLQARGMHLFYGILVGTGALLQVMLRRKTVLGHTLRGRPLVHGCLCLFVALVALRSWMSG